MGSPSMEMLAVPDSPEESKLQAWYMDDSVEDQRKPNKQNPNKPCSLSTLRALGILSWTLDPDDSTSEARLLAIRKTRGYSYEDVITCSPEHLPGYEEKLKMFFEEHIHSDEEIRYILEGSGYFDVRDFDDKWIRIECKKGTMIVLPAGIYHRFTLDTDNYIKANRLFVGEPVWTPYNRPQEEHPSRLQYLKAFICAA